MGRKPKIDFNKLVEESVHIEQYKEYKRNMPEKYHLAYDKILIDDFLKNKKREVKKIEKELIKKEYWLKYNKKLLNKKLKREIVPPLIKNEITPTGTQATLDSEYNIQVYTYLKRNGIPLEIRETKYQELDRALASLLEEDRLLIKMKFGLMPFEKEYKYVDIAKFFIEYYKGTIQRTYLFCQDISILDKIFIDINAENLRPIKNFKETTEFNTLLIQDQKLIIQQLSRRAIKFPGNKNYSNNAFLSKRVKELLVELKHPLSILCGETLDDDYTNDIDEETFNYFNGNIFYRDEI